MSWVDVTTAVGTAGAAIVALGLGLRGIYLDHLRARDEELRQARLVILSEPFPLGITPEGDRPVAIKVFNYSSEPIHQVSVGLDIWRGGGLNAKPDDHRGVQLDFLAPHDEDEIILKLPEEADSFTGTLGFLDSSGRLFKRSSNQAEPQRILHPPVLVVQIMVNTA